MWVKMKMRIVGSSDVLFGEVEDSDILVWCFEDKVR